MSAFVEALLATLPEDRQREIRGSFEYAYMHGCADRNGGRLWYERAVMALIERRDG